MRTPSPPYSGERVGVRGQAPDSPPLQPMHHHPLDRIDRLLPRRPLDHLPRVCMTRLATFAHAARREVDVLRVVLAVQARRHQVRHMHRRAAAP